MISSSLSFALLLRALVVASAVTCVFGKPPAKGGKDEISCETLQPTDVEELKVEDGKFNYLGTDLKNNDYGPEDWGEVRCSDINTCPGWPTNWEQWNSFIPYDTTENRCLDCSVSSEGECTDHRMSPIDLYRNITKTNECRDRHRMRRRPGECPFKRIKFEILPHTLRAYMPKRCGKQHPTIDFSRGFPKPWLLRFTQITLPSQHTQDGKRYDGEVVLSHTYSVNNGFKMIGNVAVFLEKGRNKDHYDFLELYIKQWERTEGKVKRKCKARRVLATDSPNNTTIAGSDVDFQKEEDYQEEPELIKRPYFNREYDPYDFVEATGTEYYFRYVGSMPEPPCFGPVHWRVLKNPVKVSPRQLVKLNSLLANRIDPTTCQKYTAGQPRQQRTYRYNYNRPTQTITRKHDVVYCECVDWNSRQESDRSYCLLPMAERGVEDLVELLKNETETFAPTFP